MSFQINNKQPRLLGTCTGRKLMPGKNVFEISDEAGPGRISVDEIQKILQDPTFKSWQKLAWVSVVPPKAERAAVDSQEAEEPINALEEMKSSDAGDMIAACSDLELLAQWHEQDKRKGVKSMIEARIAELESPDDQG